MLIREMRPEEKPRERFKESAGDVSITDSDCHSDPDRKEKSFRTGSGVRCGFFSGRELRGSLD